MGDMWSQARKDQKEAERERREQFARRRHWAERGFTYVAPIKGGWRCPICNQITEDPDQHTH